MEVYKDDVEEIIFRTQGEISDLKEKKDKYIERTDAEVSAKEHDVQVLNEIAKDLPEKQPDIFDAGEIGRTIVGETDEVEDTREKIGELHE